MESQSLRKGNAISSGLEFHRNYCEAGASPLSCHWFPELLCEAQSQLLWRTTAHRFESQIFSGRHHEECIVSYCSWGGDVFTLTFLSSTDISTVPSKTYLWDQELVHSLQS